MWDLSLQIELVEFDNFYSIIVSSKKQRINCDIIPYDSNNEWFVGSGENSLSGGILGWKEGCWCIDFVEFLIYLNISMPL